MASETFFGFRLVLFDRAGRATAGFGAPFGLRSAASFSPDGTAVAISTTLPLGEGLTADTELLLGQIGTLRALTNNSSNEGRPTWSPDGQTIAYASDRDGDWDVYVAPLSAAGEPTMNLTAGSSAVDRNPRWSPDGTAIAFESDRGGNTDVYVVGPGGGPLQAVSSSPANERLGDWAPDSSRLVLASDRAGAFDLYVVDRNGGSTRRLTDAPGIESNPVWSPDGAEIAFTSDRDGDGEVYVIGVDGQSERRVTNNASEDLVQDWQPLRDTRPPTVRALASTGPRGQPIRLRFRVAEDTRRAVVEIEIEYSPRARGTAGFSLRAYDPARTYTATIDRPPLGVVRSPFRFCVHATDPSANVGAPSCALYRFR